MACYRFADLTVDMDCHYPLLSERARPYQVTAQKPDFLLRPPARWRDYYLDKNPALTDAQIELIALNQAFSDAVLAYQGMVLHASGIVFQQEGLLFAAASGVGKSTHTRLWQQVFGADNVPIFNDDQPAIRQLNGSYYTYGTPFSGNSRENFPCKVPLKAIFCLEQSTTNQVALLTPCQALPRLIQLTMTPRHNPQQLENLLQFLDGLLRQVPVYLLSCTPDAESVSAVCLALYPGLVLSSPG